MKEKENKLSIEKEVKKVLLDGKTQEGTYNFLKNRVTDVGFIDKVTDYLPNNIREKNKYFNYLIILLLLVNVILNFNILVILTSFIMYFFLKEMSGYGYRILLWFVFLNIVYIYFTVSMSYFTYIRIILWGLLGLTSFIFYKRVFRNKTITGKTKTDQNGDYLFID